MKASDRRIGFVGFGAMAASVFVAGLAWACTGQSVIQVSAALTPAGSRIVVSQQPGGPGFGPGVAEIRWNSLEGPKLATVSLQAGEVLSAPVIIPDVAPGTYYILLKSAGNQTEVGRVPIEVSSGSGASVGRSVDGSLWSGFANAEQSTGAIQNEAANRTSGGSSAALAGGLALIGIGSAGVLFAVVQRSKGRSRKRQTR